jgi:ferrous iron transport protein A
MIDEPINFPLSPLSALKAGESGDIHSIFGPPTLVRHLAELGLHAGAPVEMIRPGVTCILRVSGTKLCIRGDELLRVMIVPLSTTARQSA